MKTLKNKYQAHKADFILIYASQKATANYEQSALLSQLLQSFQRFFNVTVEV